MCSSLISVNWCLQFYDASQKKRLQNFAPNAWDTQAGSTTLDTSLISQAAYDKSLKGINPVVFADNGPEFIGKKFLL